jgi:UDP-N-acetylglucosamine 2-epimerase (non-hydrolysing)
MQRLKVMTIVGTRPELIRLSRVVAVLEQTTDHQLVHTGQNYDYELNEIFFRDLGMPKPSHYLEAAGGTAAETIGNTIIRADEVLAKENPDAVLVLGDTNSCLAVIPAKRRKIPVFHMEAGNRCFDMRVPEEINRRIIDHVSDINFCYTEHARRYLVAENFPPDRVIKSGSPMKEVLDFHRDSIDASDIHQRLELGKGRYFTVSLHREENVDQPKNLATLVGALNDLVERFGYPVIFSVHPRTRKRLEAGNHTLDPLVRPLPPLGFFDYVKLQKDACCTLSDSGTITEESSILGFPAVTLREAHERPEGVDEGAVIMTGVCRERIMQAVELTIRQFETFGPCRIPADYNIDQVSWTVTKAILGYTDYVKRKVWSQYD